MIQSDPRTSFHNDDDDSTDDNRHYINDCADGFTKAVMETETPKSKWLY